MYKNHDREVIALLFLQYKFFIDNIKKLKKFRHIQQHRKEVVLSAVITKIYN